jgi:hypothetical protein
MKMPSSRLQLRGNRWEITAVPWFLNGMRIKQTR